MGEDFRVRMLIRKLRHDHEVRDQLREIVRKSEVLSAATVKLNDMAVQLQSLRESAGHPDMPWPSDQFDRRSRDVGRLDSLVAGD
jgi:hypothetical protein